MTWLEFAPALLLAVVVLFVPGLVLGWAGGIRRLTLWASAPAISVAFIAVAAIGFGAIGVGWSLLSVGLAVVVVAALVWGIHRVVVMRRGPSEAVEPHADRWSLIALIVAAAVIGTLMVLALQAPDRVSQTFDAFFHLNAIRYILDSGSASSFDIQGLVLAPGAHAFYPSAWHGVTSLVASAGVEIPAAVNAVSLAVAALVWPAGCLVLVRALLPRSAVATLSTGVLVAAFPAFPILMVTFGVLYPYFLALALLPGALGVAFALGQEQRWRRRAVVGRAVVLVAYLVAMGLAQPAAAFAWSILVLPLVVWRVVAWTRGLPRGRRLLWWGVLAVGLAVFALAWVWFGRVGQYAPWPSYTNPPVALWEAVVQGFDGRIPSIVVGVLGVVGVVDLIRRRDRLWFLASWVIAVALFATAASVPSWRLRAWVVGVFYRDPPRLASLLVIVAVPMAVIGVVALVRWMRARSERLREASDRRPVVFAAVGTVALLLLTQANPAIWDQVRRSAATYTDAADAPTLSGDERRLIERVPQHVEPDAVVAGNPWTGAGLVYALTGRRALNPHFSSRAFGEAAIINERLDQALVDPEVCEAVRSAGVTHVLDFGTYFRDAGETDFHFDGLAGFEGLVDLDEVAEEVDREGDAVLYRITACG